MPNTYQVGQSIRITLTSNDVNGNPVDATAITMIVTDPNKNKQTYTLVNGDIVHDSLGRYHIDLVSMPFPGQWYRHWSAQYGAGVNAPTGVFESSWYVAAGHG